MKRWAIRPAEGGRARPDAGRRAAPVTRVVIPVNAPCVTGNPGWLRTRSAPPQSSRSPISSRSRRRTCATWPCGRPRGWPRTGRRRVDEGLVQRGRWTRRAKERKSHREAAADATASGTGPAGPRPGSRDRPIPGYTETRSRYSIRVGRDDLAAVPRPEGPDDLLGRARLQEADGSHRPWRHCRLPMVATHAVHAGTVEVAGPDARPAIRIRGVRRERGCCPGYTRTCPATNRSPASSRC